MDRPILDDLRISKGGHSSREQGTCLMEAVAWWAGEPHSDHPKCASRVLGSFGISLNDALPDELRYRMTWMVPRLVGTAGKLDLDKRAGWMAADWIVRHYTPTWLELAGITEEAAALRALPEIVDVDTLKAGYAAQKAARERAAAAWAAAWDAAGDAAWDAAGDAAWDAAWAAAGDAAWAAAWDAAWTAAWAAAGAAAGDAAWDAAGDALAPTVRELQLSAIELFERMVALWYPAGHEADREMERVRELFAGSAA